ncbi:MAG: sulfotransferase, partial [Streptosporangiaceae bacterium]
VGWQQRVNGTLRRTVGYELNRPAGHPSRRLWPPEDRRVLRGPVIIFSAARSGSTLLRMILGSHTQVYAPPELPLMHLRVRAETKWIQTSMRELQLTQESLDASLWDRVLGDLLARSGKPTIAVKTPSNILVWRQIAEAWPDARFVYLLRHPASAVASLNASFDPSWHPSESGRLHDPVRGHDQPAGDLHPPALHSPGPGVRAGHAGLRQVQSRPHPLRARRRLRQSAIRQGSGPGSAADPEPDPGCADGYEHHLGLRQARR